MLEAIKQSKIRYSKKCDHPGSRKLRKFSHAAHLNSTDTSNKGPEVAGEVWVNLDPLDFSFEGKGGRRKREKDRKKKSEHSRNLAKHGSKPHVKDVRKRDANAGQNTKYDSNDDTD